MNHSSRDGQKIGGSKGGARDAHPHWGSKFFHFHAVFGKKLNHNPALLGGPIGAPPGKILDPPLKMSAKNHSGRVFSIHSGRKRIAQISWVCTCICALSIQQVLSLLETKCNETFFYHNHASRPENLTNHDVANHCLGQHIKRVQPFPECKQMQKCKLL